MKKKILLINGPNLNLLGKREPDVYGNEDLNSLENNLKSLFPNCDLLFFQSNLEGEIINELQRAGENKTDGVVLNAGGYSHTSVSIADAIAAIDVPVVEVHISNIFQRETFRHKSIIAPYCSGSISGFGRKGYELAVKALID